MKTITIRNYTPKDKSAIEAMMGELQDHLIKIDPLKCQIKVKGYEKKYTQNFLKEIKRGRGIIYVAETHGNIIGCVGGILIAQTQKDLLGAVKQKAGRIIELIVLKKYRGKGIGKILMGKMEEYFKSKKCQAIWVDVFAPNEIAYDFYQKCGYIPRMHDLKKTIGK